MTLLRSLGVVVVCLVGAACDFGAVDPLEGDGATPDPGAAGADGGAGGGGGGSGGGGGTIEHLSFPIQPGDTHSIAMCGDCHADLATPTDPATLTCTGCHLGSHAEATELARHESGPGVGDHYAWSGDACITCHPASDVYPRSEHDRGALDHHENETCTACHPARSDLAPATFQSTRCTPCHEGTPD